MVDIFDEIQEDLRAERAEKLLKKYAWLLIAVVVLIIGGAVGWQFWERYQNQRDATAATEFVSTMNDTATPAAALATLDRLAKSAPEGYKTLARLRAATLKANANDLKGAETLWNQVAADSSADPLLRDFASLMATSHEIDHGDPTQLAARLGPLAVPTNPWSSLAREQLALLDLRQGKIQDARSTFKDLSADIEAPSGVRARAAALLESLGPQDQN